MIIANISNRVFYMILLMEALSSFTYKNKRRRINVKLCIYNRVYIYMLVLLWKRAFFHNLKKLIESDFISQNKFPQNRMNIQIK